MTSWDDDFNAFMGNDAGPSDSFIDRARAAPDDDDFNMGEDYGAPPPPGLAHVAVLGQDVAEETALQQLIRHWMNERHAPDILPGQEMLLGRILDHVRKQVSFCVLFSVHGERAVVLWFIMVPMPSAEWVCKELSPAHFEMLTVEEHGVGWLLRTTQPGQMLTECSCSRTTSSS